MIIYAPIVGLIVFEPARRIAMRSLFRTTGAAMRYRLVPSLVAQATDAQLAELAARNAVSIRGQSLRAVDTGKEVIVWTEASGYFGGEAAVLDDFGSVEMGDGGGGLAGGGGDGGGDRSPIGRADDAVRRRTFVDLWKVRPSRATVTDMA